jgi:hypothetical protein
VTCPKSWCGDVSRPRWSPSRFPGVLPGPSPRWRRDRRAWCGRRCRESAFEAAHSFVGRLAGGDFPVVVGTSLCGVAQLDHGHHVKNPVDLAVPAPGQAVTDVVAGGGVNRGGAGPGREVALGREPGNVTDLDQQPGGAGGADAVQAEQCGACLFDQGGELLVRGLLARVDPRPLLLTAFSCLRLDGVDWCRRAPLLPAGHSLLQPLPPVGGRGSACQMRVTRRTWTAAEERPPRPPEPNLGQGPIWRQWN